MERSLSGDQLLGLGNEEFVNIDLQTADIKKRGKYIKMRQLQEGEQEIDTSDDIPHRNPETPEELTSPSQGTGIEITASARYVQFTIFGAGMCMVSWGDQMLGSHVGEGPEEMKYSKTPGGRPS